MQWFLYGLGLYVAVCYIWAMGMLVRIYLGGRSVRQLRRRLTRLLPGRAVARTTLPRQHLVGVADGSHEVSARAA